MEHFCSRVGGLTRSHAVRSIRCVFANALRLVDDWMAVSWQHPRETDALKRCVCMKLDEADRAVSRMYPYAVVSMTVCV